MTSRTLLNLTVAVAMTLVIGLLAGPSWPMWLVAAVLTLALTLGVWIGSGPGVAEWTLQPGTYAAAAAFAVLLGWFMWQFTGGDNATFWGVGVVMAIALSSGFSLTRHE